MNKETRTKLDKEIVNLNSTVTQMQEQFKTDRTYKRFSKPDLIDFRNSELDFDVHEYVTPAGEKGWILYTTKILDGKTWRKVVDNGVENRSLDWYEIIL